MPRLVKEKTSGHESRIRRTKRDFDIDQFTGEHPKGTQTEIAGQRPMNKFSESYP